MLLIATLFVGFGISAFAYGLTQTRVALGARPVAELVEPVEVLDDTERRRVSVVYRALEPMFGLGAVLRRVSPVAWLDRLKHRMVLAGMEHVDIERVLAWKAAATALGVVVGLVVSPGRIPAPVWALLVGAIFSFVPDLIVSRRAAERQGRIALAVPQALDLLAISVEAGLGLEGALQLVVDRASGPLRMELNRLLRELELGVGLRDGLIGLRRRTDVAELSSLALALVQADELGISVGEVLRGQADQARLKRRQRAHEQAAKTPVKILFPMVFGIFPAMFVVTVGPGAITIAEKLFK